MDYSEFIKKTARSNQNIKFIQEKCGMVNIRFLRGSSLSIDFYHLICDETKTSSDFFDFFRKNHMDTRQFNRYCKWYAERIVDLLPNINIKSEPVKEPAKPRLSSVKPSIISIVSEIKKSLIGCDQQYEEFADAIQANSKAILLAGHHGLGKTKMVEDMAQYFGAVCCRVQVTEFTSEIDLVGSIEPNTGKFLKGVVYNAVEQSLKNPQQTYFLFFDEFTRGRDEAMTVIYPLLAEKKLVVNNPHAEHQELSAGKNLIVIGTGNVEDKGLRQLGGAEFDRWRSVQFKFITDKSILRKICKHALFDEQVFDKLVQVYNLSVQYYKEKKILAMSIRTMISTLELAKVKFQRGYAPMDALCEALKQDYMTSSQAFINPAYMNTYNQIMREAGL